ncbi:hypothetical protein FOZ60_001918 [Perkinsus olseni]|uniref:Uncharacterized protein n=1 Tax=Perkinsus olseni TaxID=32597 RepID=A0A7J6NZE5_PEROL|nr:hypothetical protein FOZ60_001918 [Perkinsus olseni]
MITPSRVVFFVQLGAISALGLRTASASEIQSIREEIAGINDRLEKLSGKVDQFVDLVKGDLEGKLQEGTIAKENACELSFGERQKILVNFEDKSQDSLTPITGSFYTSTTGAFIARFEKTAREWLDIGSTMNSTSISHNLEEARQHFSSVLPFEHLIGTPVMEEVRAYLPITPRDQEKCEKIFALLARNPPGNLEKGIRWFGRFNRAAMNVIRSLIKTWKEKHGG